MVELTVSPLAVEFPGIPAIGGVRFAAAAAGIKYPGREDVMLAALDPGTVIAGVFTRSLTASAPVEWCRRSLAGGAARALLVNSGNANAFTGAEGERAVVAGTAAVAAALGCRAEEVFPASTGVIGEPLPAERIVARVPALVTALDGGAWRRAASAIMTTDTFPKGAVRQTRIGDRPVTVAGFAKGSGMIAPDMATMLCFLFTDAAISPAVLQRILSLENERTFNCITVDGDTSTSDTLLLAATGAAGNLLPASAADRALGPFRRALREVLTDLAVQVVRDGEGASKLITIDVTGAASFRAARRVGLVIGNSPLVKTAIAGEDANWGRIVMAVGKSGQRAERDALAIRIGGIPVAAGGRRVPDYDESRVADHLKGSEIEIAVDLGVGRGRARTWTCDLTHGYIRINADYRS